MADGAITDPSISRAEHDDVEQAKRVLNLLWAGTGTIKAPAGMFTKPFDDMVFSSADANGNYQVLTTKLTGTTQETYALTYDASSNLTRFHRTS